MRPLQSPLAAPLLPIHYISYSSSPFPGLPLEFTITSNSSVPQIYLQLPVSTLFRQSVSTSFFKRVPRALAKLKGASVHAEKVRFIVPTLLT